MLQITEKEFKLIKAGIERWTDKDDSSLLRGGKEDETVVSRECALEYG